MFGPILTTWRRPILLLTLLASVGCRGGGGTSNLGELHRVTNEAGTIDAIVAIQKADGDPVYKVVIVPKGAALVESATNIVLEVTQPEGHDKGADWKPKWRSNQRLQLRLKRGQISKYSNFATDEDGHKVGIRLLVDGYGFD